MQEGKRQKQVAGVLNEALNEIFQKLGLTMVDGGMVSIAAVKVTPDLMEARVYLSFFQVQQPDAAMKIIHDRAWEIKRELAAKIRRQLRCVPELQYFLDDTLDHVFKMEELFKQIKNDNPE
jgi:ribosome-binding factor A